MQIEYWPEEEARRMICPLMTFAEVRHCCTVECPAWGWRDKRNGDDHGTCKHLQHVREVVEPPTRFSR